MALPPKKICYNEKVTFTYNNIFIMGTEVQIKESRINKFTLHNIY